MTGAAPQFTLERLVGILGRYAFRYANEDQLQVAIASVLTAEGIPFERERVDGANRYDFFCGGVVLEVKMDRSYSEAVRQVSRYCESPLVHAVVLGTTKSWSASSIARGDWQGKPVAMVRLRGQSF